jgi:hypothetical protein
MPITGCFFLSRMWQFSISYRLQRFTRTWLNVFEISQDSQSLPKSDYRNELYWLSIGQFHTLHCTALHCLTWSQDELMQNHNLRESRHQIRDFHANSLCFDVFHNKIMSFPINIKFMFISFVFTDGRLELGAIVVRNSIDFMSFHDWDNCANVTHYLSCATTARR